MARISILFFITIIFLVSAIELFAQNFASVKWGPEIKGYKTGSIYPIGFDETGYYMISANMFGYFFQKLDTNLSQVVKTEFIRKNETKGDYKLEGITYFNNKILVLKSSTAIKEKKRSLFIDSLSKTTLLPVGNSAFISQFKYTGERNKGSFWTDTSSNGKLLLLVINLPGKKKANAQFNLIVYDSSLTKVWEKQIELNANEKLFRVQEFWITNNGNVFINGKNYFNNKGEQFKWKQNFHQSIFAIYNRGETVKQFEIDIGRPFFNSALIKINNREQIICSGLYSNKSRLSVDGFFYLIYDSTQTSPLHKTVKEFKLETLTDAVIDRKQNRIEMREGKGKENEMPLFTLKDLILDKDGGSTLIAEQEYNPYYALHYDGRYYIHYLNNDDILVFKSDSLRNIKWHSKIPKKQKSKYHMGHYSSYFHFYSDSSEYFIFNDHKGNSLAPDKKSDRKDFSLSDEFGSASIVKVNNKGETSKCDLYNLKETKIILRPKSCRQINSNTLLIFGEKEKKEQYAIVKLRE